MTSKADRPDVSAAAFGDASVYVPITPCRVVDTRRGGGGVFRSGHQRSYAVWGTGPAFAAQGGRSGGCGIPVTAIAVEATVTAVAPTAGGFTRAWPSDEPEPNATFLNYAGGSSISNTGALGLSYFDDLDLTIKNYAGQTHYVIDVMGYFDYAFGPDGPGV